MLKTTWLTIILFALLAASPAQAQDCRSRLENGDFEAATAPPLTGKGYRHLDAFPGWRVTGGDATKLEIQRDLFGGGQYLELASTGRTWVSQSVGTSPGGYYTLFFSYRARPGHRSEVEVYWNSRKLASLPESATPAGAWHVYHYSVQGTGNDEITFRDVSPADGGGGLIDDVSLCSCG